MPIGPPKRTNPAFSTPTAVDANPAEVAVVKNAVLVETRLTITLVSNIADKTFNDIVIILIKSLNLSDATKVSSLLEKSVAA